MIQSVSIVLLALLAYRVVVKSHAQINICNSTEVNPISTSTDKEKFPCICNMLSTTCWWSLFADRENTFNSGTINSTFKWDRSIGYGQYICVEDNSTIVKDILILPQGEKSRTMHAWVVCYFYVCIPQGRGYHWFICLWLNACLYLRHWRSYAKSTVQSVFLMIFFKISPISLIFIDFLDPCRAIKHT